MATLAPSTRSTRIVLASASAGPFLVGFRLFEASSLAVFVNDALRTDWTLSATFNDGYDDTASITFTTGLSTADVILIDGELLARRAEDYLPSDPGLTRKLNIELPRIWSSIQELTRKASRSVRSMTAIDAFVPQAGKTITFNDQLNPIPGPSVDQISGAQASATAAQVAAAAAQAAQAAAEAAEGSIVERMPRTITFRGDGIINSITFDGVYTSRKAIRVFVGQSLQVPLAPIGETERYTQENDGSTTTLTFDEPFKRGWLVFAEAQTQISLPVADPDVMVMPDGSSALDLWNSGLTLEGRAAAEAAALAAHSTTKRLRWIDNGRVLRIARDAGSVALPGILNWSPEDDQLNLLMAGSTSDLASGFDGIMAQAIADCAARNWKLLVPRGNWETKPIVYDFPGAGALDVEFAPGAKLIGAAQFQHFAGNGVQKAFTVTAWASASTDTLSVMKVTAAGVETGLTFGDAVNGFTRVGNIVTVGSAVTIATGDTLAVAPAASILKITGENGDVRLRLRGGHFDNGQMGYIFVQASGSCVNFKTIRGIDWDGAPIFENSSGKSWMDAPLLRRGDSGLVLENVERANIWGGRGLYQPDHDVYVTGLARGAPPETYYLDDGFGINIWGWHSLGTDTAFRDARKGGGFGLYGCSVEKVSSGLVVDDVSSGGLGSSRNISVQGLTGRKIGRDFLDIRGVDSCVLSGILIEDWGRKPDGTSLNTNPLLNFGAVAHLHATGIVARYEEWTQPATPQPIVSFNAGRTVVDKFEARLQLPYASVGNGAVGVATTGAIGSLGLLPLDLTTINVDTPTSDGTGSKAVLSARVKKITTDFGATFSQSAYQVQQGRVIAETTGVAAESTGVAVVPTLTIQTPNGAVVTPSSSTGKYVREGNIIHAKLSMQVNVAWGGGAPSGYIRMTWGAGQLPDIGEIFGTHVSFWNTTNPVPGNISDISIFRSAVNQLSIRMLKEDGTNAILDAAAFYATTSTFFRIDLSFSYALDGVL